MRDKNEPPIGIAEITIESAERPTLKIGLQNYDLLETTFSFTADRYLPPDDIYLDYLASIESKVKCVLSDREKTEFSATVIDARVKQDEQGRIHPWAKLGNVEVLSRKNASEEELLRIEQFNFLSSVLT